MLFGGWRIEGPFAGMDPVVVVASVALVGFVVTVVAFLALQVARLQPNVAAPGTQAARRVSSEFDQWTERGGSPTSKEAEYQAMYGSPRGPPSYVSTRAPPLPAPPPMGEVVVNVGGRAPVQESGWVELPTNLGPSAASLGPPVPTFQPPARPVGPTDEVVAPAHSRRGRDGSTGMLPSEETPPLSFERSSAVPGALAPRAGPGDPFSPVAPAPPPTPAPQRGLDEAARMKVAQALPEMPPAPASTRGSFRQSARDRTVMGAGSTGMGEGEELSPTTKTIRCPKCATVFPGPASRPATVRCPACGTSGTLR